MDSVSKCTVYDQIYYLYTHSGCFEPWCHQQPIEFQIVPLYRLGFYHYRTLWHMFLVLWTCSWTLVMNSTFLLHLTTSKSTHYVNLVLTWCGFKSCSLPLCFCHCLMLCIPVLLGYTTQALRIWQKHSEIKTWKQSYFNMIMVIIFLDIWIDIFIDCFVIVSGTIKTV